MTVTTNYQTDTKLSATLGAVSDFVQLSTDPPDCVGVSVSGTWAGAAVTISTPVVTRYYRVVYVNGASAQTAFMLNSSYSV